MEHRIRGALYLLVIIFLLAFILRVLPLQEYHSWDESIYLQHAEHIAFGKDNYDELDFRPPLLSLLIAGVFKLHHSIYLADILIALLSASIVIPLHFIGRNLHSDQAGLFAAFIAALHPAFVTYGHLILTDAVVASFLACALLFALNNRWHILLLAGVFTGLAALTKFTGLGAAPALLLFILMKDLDWMQRARQAAAFAGGVFVTILPYVIWVQSNYGLSNFFMRTHEIVNLDQGGMLIYLSPAIFIAPLIAGVALLLLFGMHLHKRVIVLAAAWFLLIIGYLYRFPNREVRYALAAIVPLFILAGIGYALYLESFKRKRALGAIIILVLITMLCISSFSRLTEPTVNHWKSPSVGMAQYIASLNTSDPLYVTSFYPVYGYYTANPIVVVDGPYFLQHQRDLMPESGYLVVYNDSQKIPTISWADQQENLQKVRERDGIVLYRYTY